jgi:ParB family chromosome partitioning protein
MSLVKSQNANFKLNYVIKIWIALGAKINNVKDFKDILTDNETLFLHSYTPHTIDIYPEKNSLTTSTEMRRLNDLKATNPYLRMGTDVEDLEKSIRTVGLIAPLVISKDNVILAGARRYQAMLNLGFTEAPVIVKDLSELERELISIDENLVRKDLSKIEIEGHLRRAKEIYQALNPHEEKVEIIVSDESNENEKVKKEVLPAEKFLNMVSEKTGLSPKQIHEAINRDEQAHEIVKIARQNGELSLSQTNEIVKLKKDEQKKSIEHLKTLPVREIKAFVKKAKTSGVETAIKEMPKVPHAREFNEVEQILKRLNKKLKQLELEGISIEHFPKNVRELFDSITMYASFEEYMDTSPSTKSYANTELHN